MRLLASSVGSTLAAELAAILAGNASRRPTDAFLAGDHANLWSILASGGWLAAGLPETAGGAGADLRDLLELAVAWGGYLAPLPFLETVLTYRWLGGAPTPGDAHTAPITFAVPVSEGLLVPHAARPGIRLFAGQRVVPAAIPPLESIDEFAPSLPLGIVRNATPLAEEQVAELAALAAGQAVGAARKCLADAIAHACERVAFGKAIATFQSVRHLLADMHTNVEIAMSAAVWAAQPGAVGRDRAARFCLAQSRGVITDAIQTFGGMGFTWELGIHFYLRHVLALERLTGTSPKALSARGSTSRPNQRRYRG